MPDAASSHMQFKYIIIHFEGRGGESKYNDHVIDGGGGLETAKNG